MNELQVPQPKSKVVHFDHIQTFDQAYDYAMGGYHASLKKASKDTAVGRLWQDAADAYYGAYLAMAPLKALSSDQSLAKARELLHDANHKADVAAAGASNS